MQSSENTFDPNQSQILNRWGSESEIFGSRWWNWWHGSGRSWTFDVLLRNHSSADFPDRRSSCPSPSLTSREGNPSFLQDSSADIQTSSSPQKCAELTIRAGMTSDVECTNSQSPPWQNSCKMRTLTIRQYIIIIHIYNIYIYINSYHFFDFCCTSIWLRLARFDQMSGTAVIEVIAVDVGPLENSSARSNLSQRVVKKLQFDDCKSMLVVKPLHLAFDVLPQTRTPTGPKMYQKVAKTQKSVCEPDKNDLRMNTGSPALQWQSVSCHDHGPWTAQSRTCTCQARAWLWLYFSLHLRACPPLTVYRRYCTGNTWVRRNWQLSSLIANSSFFTHLACGRWGPLSGSLCQDKHCHYRPQRVSVEMTRYLYKSCPGSQTWSHLSR